MTHIRRRTRAAAAATLTAALALSGVVATTGAAQASPDQPAFDYFAQSIPGLRDGSVFEAVTYERLQSLLASDGTYALLIGGPEDPTVQAAAAHIDAIAQEYGVDAIYTFDPRLDGANVDIRNSPIAQAAALWTTLTDDALNRDTTPEFTGGPDDPYLVIYDRDHQVDEQEDRIVASLGGALTAQDLDTGDEASAFRAEISDVFDAVAIAGQAQVDAQSQFEFLSNAVNSRHVATYTDPALFGGEILGDEQAADFVIKSITYDELVTLLGTSGDHTILFGGTWCHNTRAVIRDINDTAAAAGVDTVYLFDLRLDGLNDNNLHIRSSNSALSYLYGDIADGLLTNLRTQYQMASGSASQRVDYYPGGDTTLPVQAAKKLQVPYLITYNEAAEQPIQKDWVRDNGDGTVTEFMTEYWWVNDLPGKRNANKFPDTPEGDTAWAAEQAKQWAFGDAALTALDTFFAPDAVDPEPISITGATPTLTGTGIAVGKRVTARPGTWTATQGGTELPAGSVALSYRWLRNGAPISGATASTYTLRSTDLGRRISVVVTGTRADAESVSKTSAQTGAVAKGRLTAATPRVSGTHTVRKTLKVRTGTWGPSGVKVRVQWLRNGKAIRGATKTSYRLAKADAGKRVSVKVTGTLNGYQTVSKVTRAKKVRS